MKKTVALAIATGICLSVLVAIQAIRIIKRVEEIHFNECAVLKNTIRNLESSGFPDS